jgi:hypothetical protein
MEGRSSTPVDSRRAEGPVDASTRSDAVGSSSGGTMPGTAVRKNITQRRLRGRAKDDGETAPRASLLARRPRSRSKDRRYSIESIGNDVQLLDVHTIFALGNDEALDIPSLTESYLA